MSERSLFWFCFSLCFLVHGILNLWFSSVFKGTRERLGAWRDGHVFEDGIARLLRKYIGGALLCRFCLGYHLCFLIGLLLNSTLIPNAYACVVIAFGARGIELLLEALTNTED